MSREAWDIFKKGESIDTLINKANETAVKEKEKQRLANREYMFKLLDIIRTLVKGRKPLRGHDEKSTSHERGLFLEVVGLLKRHYPDFQLQFESRAQNCTYLTKLYLLTNK